MLFNSETLPQLAAIFPPEVADPDSDEPYFSLYGDPVYPMSYLCFGEFHNAHPQSIKSQWNTQMSKVREVVE